jgi:hypothetical protein
MKKMILLLVVATVALACQKEELPDAPPTPPEPETNYYPLTTGSYWVYQMYQVAANGSENELNSTDSVIIIGDTTINENIFAVFEKTSSSWNSSHQYYVRDSSGYMIDVHGNAFFTSKNFTDTLSQGDRYVDDNDTTSMFIYSYSSIMEIVDNPLTVPAGSFDVINHKTTTFTNENIPVTNPRYINTYYADNVGKIMYTNFYFSSDEIELQWRLINYHIEP